MRIAVVGVTGLVGNTIVDVLEERNFPITEFLPVASERSVGKEIVFKGEKHKIMSIAEAIARKPQLALFSAGSSVSSEFAPIFASAGCKVIDNSSAWRMDSHIKLIVPEVNGHYLTRTDNIIANPNCSTIQLVMVLAPLHLRYGVKRVVVSTYQSVTGTGTKAVKQLLDERTGKEGPKAYPHQIDLNVLPHIDIFQDNGHTKEEMKIIQETKKIIGDETIRVTATAVRVPIMGGHSESVNIELQSEFNEPEIRKMLSETFGVVVMDDVLNNQYPMPRDVAGRDEVFVGRIRRDYSQPNSLNCWIVADNLRKGAATNAVQIAELVIGKGFID